MIPVSAFAGAAHNSVTITAASQIRCFMARYSSLCNDQFLSPPAALLQFFLSNSLSRLSPRNHAHAWTSPPTLHSHTPKYDFPVSIAYWIVASAESCLTGTTTSGLANASHPPRRQIVKRPVVRRPVRLVPLIRLSTGSKNRRETPQNSLRSIPYSERLNLSIKRTRLPSEYEPSSR